MKPASSPTDGQHLLLAVCSFMALSVLACSNGADDNGQQTVSGGSAATEAAGGGGSHGGSGGGEQSGGAGGSGTAGASGVASGGEGGNESGDSGGGGGEETGDGGAVGSAGDSESAGTGGSAGEGNESCTENGDGRTTLAFVNLCAETISFRGSDIEGGDVGPGNAVCREVGSSTEEFPSKRYWGFIGADPGGGRRTLAEFTFNTDFYDFDWYNLSHVDAHNLPLQIVPTGMPDCPTLTCADSPLENCPPRGPLSPERRDRVVREPGTR